MPVDFFRLVAALCHFARVARRLASLFEKRLDHVREFGYVDRPAAVNVTSLEQMVILFIGEAQPQRVHGFRKFFAVDFAAAV